MMPLLRRRVVLGVSGLVLAGVAPGWASEAEVDGLIRSLVGEGVLAPGYVKLDLPQLVENGNAVSMTVDATKVPGRVVSMHVFAGRNPLPEVVSARFGPRSGRAVLQTRIRLATSQTVIVVAKGEDGRCWSDSVDLLVTLAACIE